MNCLPDTGWSTPALLLLATIMTLLGAAILVAVRRHPAPVIGLGLAVIALAGVSQPASAADCPPPASTTTVASGGPVSTAASTSTPTTSSPTSSSTTTSTSSTTSTSTSTSTSTTVPVRPDLTPVIELPSNGFAVDETKTFVVYISEVLGDPTSLGTAAFNVTVPVGFQLVAYDSAMTSATPSGGAPETVVNASFVVLNAGSRTVTLQAAPGVGFAGTEFKAIGFQMRRTNAQSGNTANVTVSIFSDPTETYDTNDANNLYMRIVTAL